MELRKYKLGEIAEIYNGSTPSTKEFDNYDGKCNYCGLMGCEAGLINHKFNEQMFK